MGIFDELERVKKKNFGKKCAIGVLRNGQVQQKEKDLWIRLQEKIICRY